MGAGAEILYHREIAKREQEVAPFKAAALKAVEDELNEVDCKDYALRYAAKHRDLSPVRGYALFPHGYTEHWWLSAKTGTIVDVTSLRSVAGGHVIYVPLPETKVLQSTCDAFSGPCTNGADTCEWCVVRLALDARGHQRVRLDVLGHRLVFDRLFFENEKLRAELRKLKGES